MFFFAELTCFTGFSKKEYKGAENYSKEPNSPSQTVGCSPCLYPAYFLFGERRPLASTPNENLILQNPT